MKYIVSGKVLLAFSLSIASALMAQAQATATCKASTPGADMMRLDYSLLVADRGNSAEWMRVDRIVDLIKKRPPQQECKIAKDSVKQWELYIQKPDGKGFEETIEPTTILQAFGRGAGIGTEGGFIGTSSLMHPPKPMAVEDIYVEGTKAEQDTFFGDLSDLSLVYVPRIVKDVDLPAVADCYKINSVTVVPSRVFDENLWRDDEIKLSPQWLPPVAALRTQREALETLAQQAAWLPRLSYESPKCQENGLRDSYSRLQLNSLNATMNRIFPGKDVLQKSDAFWTEVKRRIAALRGFDTAGTSNLGR